jgi:hypothetical protein
MSALRYHRSSVVTVLGFAGSGMLSLVVLCLVVQFVVCRVLLSACLTG